MQNQLSKKQRHSFPDLLCAHGVYFCVELPRWPFVSSTSSKRIIYRVFRRATQRSQNHHQTVQAAFMTRVTGFHIASTCKWIRPLLKDQRGNFWRVLLGCVNRSIKNPSDWRREGHVYQSRLKTINPLRGGRKCFSYCLVCTSSGISTSSSRFHSFSFIFIHVRSISFIFIVWICSNVLFQTQIKSINHDSN